MQAQHLQESLCNDDGELDKGCFVLVVKEQLKQHMLSELVTSMAVADPVALIDTIAVQSNRICTVPKLYKSWFRV